VQRERAREAALGVEAAFVTAAREDVGAEPLRCVLGELGGQGAPGLGGVRAAGLPGQDPVRGEVGEGEWTVRNVTDEWHTLHIHINPYQVIRINGKRVKPILWDDNVTIAPNGGSFTWRTRFTDFTGKFVMHCHVLFHEDNGMMSAVQVVE
jgi:FtsP/CotA-like multicopper oxidase with cupredoxin domain